MIELNLPTSAAVSLLNEQIQKEFEERQIVGIYDKSLTLHDLEYKKLKSLAETCVYDLIMLLPVKILIDENNLSEIICRTIKALCRIYYKEEFISYTEEEAEKILSYVNGSFNVLDQENSFLHN